MCTMIRPSAGKISTDVATRNAFECARDLPLAEAGEAARLAWLRHDATSQCAQVSFLICALISSLLAHFRRGAK